MPVLTCTCCGADPFECDNCYDGTAATTFQAIISGVTLCPTTCRNLASENDDKIISGSSPDGTYCLTQEGTGVYPYDSTFTYCSYAATLADPIVVERYASSDGSCSGGVTGTFTVDTVRVWILRSVAGPFVYGIVITIQQNVPPVLADDYIAFQFGSLAGNTKYCLDQTRSNAINSSGLCASNARVVGYGGSVTLVRDGC